MQNGKYYYLRFLSIVTRKQGIRLEKLAKHALQQYDIDQDASLKLLGYRENAVFSVTTKNDKYALRIHCYGYHSDDALRSELQWMESLSEFGVPTPPIVRGKNGDTVYIVSVEDVPEPRQIDLLEWVPGGTPDAENIV